VVILGGCISFSACSSHREAPTILIISGWQDVNIGDIAHTPGLIHLVQEKMPDSKIILWKKNPSEKVEALLAKNFPEVKIVHGDIETNQDVADAVAESDLLIHGSAPYIAAIENIENWIKHTNGKPFGFFGVTFENPSERDIAVLQKALFIYSRETESIRHLKNAGITGENILFGPDATFALHIRDEEKAQTFMSQQDLKDKDFLCVVTRFRKSPYWWADPDKYTAEEIAEKTALNDQWKYEDNDKLCIAITEWVRKTKKKVVICPEMDYQVKIVDDVIVNRLPDDVKPYIIKHDYWLPDEAISLYSHAHTLISVECHSVIMALAVGTPAFYVRQPHDTIKGQMYYDIGLGRWVFEIEQSTGEQIAQRLMEVVDDYPAAINIAKHAMEEVNKQYEKDFALMKKLMNTESELTLEQVNASLTRAVFHVKAMSKSLENQENTLPRTIDKNGQLIVSGPEWWTSGFYPGTLWYLYEFSKDEGLKQLADKYSMLIEKQKYTADNHDIGFMLYCSSGNAYRLTGDEKYNDIITTGSQSLMKRYHNHAGLIRSWDFNPDIWQYPVIIDNMMNLEMLFEVSKKMKDSTMYNAALSHADKTMKHHFRSDYSCWHVVSYDTITGLPHLKQTHQGLNDNSAWARGQAWALYGYTMTYRETKEDRFLEHAKQIANYIIHHPSIPEDKIPLWDFDATKDSPRDASSAAIMASALIELSQYVPKHKIEYLEFAGQQLISLSSDKYFAKEGANGNFILMHSTGNFPGKYEIDAPLIYADYYYVEALMRYRNLLL
jgi:polysaccharide pyruvyl transferase WcaK-like protein